MLMTRRFLITGSLGVIATRIPDAVAAPVWKILGAKRVSLGIDRDVIPVGPMPYRFDKIKIGAVLNDIEMFDLAVVYGNGTRDNIQVRRVIRRNSETAPLDLRGDGRNIKRIEMIYRKNANKGLFTLVTVSGRVA